MERPKVLYAIQGTGNGHVSRARSLYAHLSEHFDLDLALAGKNSEVKLPVKPVWTGKGITMEYNSSGRVDVLKTLSVNSLSRIRKEIAEVPVEKYDFILNDFESISLRAALRKSVPVLGLSHQAGVWDRSSPKPPDFMPVGKWILNHYARCDDHIGFHFKAYSERILTPVIRDDVLNAVHRPGDRIPVYLPAYGAHELASVFRTLPYSFTIFHREARSVLKDHNLIWEPIHAERFSKALLEARAVICSAGFELPSECLHLGIPLIVIPIRGQYEQLCNAAALRECGVPVLPKPDREALTSALDSVLAKPAVRLSYVDIRPAVISAVKDWWERMRK